jgi:signal transduction histidine kinase
LQPDGLRQHLSVQDGLCLKSKPSHWKSHSNANIIPEKGQQGALSPRAAIISSSVFMSFADQTIASLASWVNPSHLEGRLRDYVGVSKKLIYQRQAIFVAATVLGAIYFNPVIAIACYSAVLFTEVMDLVLTRQIDKWNDLSERTARRFLAWVIVNTLLSASAIGLFVIMIAEQQPTGGHFTPLFFLFAASLFAAMNNHQLMPALSLRLTIYAMTFLYISLMDLIPTPPPITDQAWLQFFTTVFVLYFILDCSFVFLRLYRNGLKQIDNLRVEHERTMKAYEVKSKFLSTVSHELRTPLTSIKASIDLINAGLLGAVPENIVPILHIAGKNSKRLADLINDLLDVQKIEAGEMVYNFATVDVRMLVLESVEANQGFADQLGIGIECSFPEDDFYIDGDEARLTQVMANLLSNALKFSPKGKNVQVFVRCDDGRVRISVQDSGIGIDEKARELVFGKFTQVDSSDQRQAGGTGLGMHISQQIVERHKGRIDFTSELGRGTTFFVEFDQKLVGPGARLSTALVSDRSTGAARRGPGVSSRETGFPRPPVERKTAVVQPRA